jgi:ABC-type nitrate/sulfonate/bicarbonate transport system ATPase subunit
MAPMTASGDAWIELGDVSRAFDGSPAVDRVTLSVPRGGRVALVGPSGCGKSTLLRLVAGLLEPTSGTVAVAAQTDAPARLERCALMPQRDLLLPWRSALDNACLPLQNAGLGRRLAREQALPLLERFGLGGFERRRPDELSGGMRQRVAFARTLLARKEVLLLDEPFGSLDALTRAELQGWLRDALAAEPRTVVLVTHDVEEGLLVCGRIAVLSPRPGTLVRLVEAEIGDGDREDVVTADGFVAARRQALEALR